MSELSEFPPVRRLAAETLDVHYTGAKFALVSERLLLGAVGVDYKTFNESAKTPFEKLVAQAYQNCAITETALLETVDQQERFTEGFVFKMSMHNDVDAERMHSLSGRAARESAELEAKLSIFKLILRWYEQDKSETKEN